MSVQKLEYFFELHRSQYGDYDVKPELHANLFIMREIHGDPLEAFYHGKGILRDRFWIDDLDRAVLDSVRCFV